MKIALSLLGVFLLLSCDTTKSKDVVKNMFHFLSVSVTKLLNLQIRNHKRQSHRDAYSVDN